MRRLLLGFALAFGVLVPNVISAEGSAEVGLRADGATDRSAEFADVGTLDRDVLDLALGAASCAMRSGSVKAPRTLTVIDYSRPSSQERLWVFDLKTRELLYEELVAHGQGTGADLATRFSNENESHQTSLGLFVTDTTYVGKNG